MQKTPRKVKVYGTDSTKNIRARLIEILMERAQYHKDKFIAPVLWEEMRSMEVKKSGKVEHSDKTHDDNVFSLLMALYVWYDGKNLIENFGIRKSTLRTDDNRDLEEADFEEALESREKVDFRSSQFETNEDIAATLEELESQKFVSSRDMQSKIYMEKVQQRQLIIGKMNNDLDDNQLDFGVTLHSSLNPQYPGYTMLPPTLFDNDYDLDTLDFDEDQRSNMRVNQKTPVAGNLGRFYDKV